MTGPPPSRPGRFQSAGLVGFLARHLAGFAGLVFASSVIFGGLLWVSPGGSRSTELESSFLAWLAWFWGGIFTWDLGPSYRGWERLELVVQGAATTLPIVLAALLVSLGVALVLALTLGDRLRRQTRALRALLHAASLTPVFVLAYFAQVFLAVPPEGLSHTLTAVFILALGDGLLTDVVLVLEAELDELRKRDFVESLRLRGAPIRRRLLPHVTLPVLQMAAAKLSGLLGGVLILEMVMGIQGLGLFGYRAAVKGDFPLLVALIVLATALVAGLHLGVSVVRFLVDPRARKSRRSAQRLGAEGSA